MPRHLDHGAVVERVGKADCGDRLLRAQRVVHLSHVQRVGGLRGKHGRDGARLGGLGIVLLRVGNRGAKQLARAVAQRHLRLVQTALARLRDRHLGLPARHELVVGMRHHQVNLGDGRRLDKGLIARIQKEELYLTSAVVSWPLISLAKSSSCTEMGTFTRALSVA